MRFQTVVIIYSNFILSFYLQIYLSIKQKSKNIIKKQIFDYFFLFLKMLIDTKL